MPRDIAQELAASHRGYLASPAGYGKTHSIAAAVHLSSQEGKQLVLTHTHAGVHALQSKLKEAGVPAALWRVETIAGWALKYAASFPAISGVTSQPHGTGWDAVYAAAERCLHIPAVRDIVTNTYAGMFVDEYQDCNIAQHELVMSLAEMLPCRLLGDPLQGIFEFAGPTVNLDDDLHAFERLEPLDVPYRWLNAGSHSLASWVQQTREDLVSGKPLRIYGPVTHIPNDHRALLGHSFGLLGRRQNTVIAHKFGNQAHSFAKGSGGKFKSMEEMDCVALMDFARGLDVSAPAQQAVLLLDQSLRMMSRISGVVNPLRDAVREGTLQLARRKTNIELVASLLRVMDGGGALELAKALDLVIQIHGAVTYRRELSRETFRMLRAMGTGKYPTYEAAAFEIREKTRQLGRPAEPLTSSRILLIKGLEYDNAVVVNADSLSRKELYVAVTRGSRSLAIQSSSRIINPS